MIKIIFFDIDSTCYYHKNKEIPQSTQLAFKLLKKQGFKIAICTSRAYEEMVMLPDSFFSIMDGIITCAGGNIYVNNKKIKSNIIDNKQCIDAINYMDNHDMTYRWLSDDGQCHLNRSEKKIDDLFFRLYQMVPSVKKYNNESLTHLLFYTYDGESKNKVTSILSNACHTDLGSANEVQANNVDKSYGIKYLANYYGYSIDECAAFGDSNNDYSMIRDAKIGIAMGNACDNLKQVADYVTDNIENDGLYNACLKYGWIKE